MCWKIMKNGTYAHIVSKNFQTSNNKAIQKLYKNNDTIDMHFDITKSDLLSKCKLE